MSLRRASIVIAASLAFVASGAVLAKKHERAAVVAQQAAQLAPQAVTRYVTDAFGDVDGLLLADGTLVRLPTHQSAQVISAVQRGDVVSVAGATAGARVVEAWTVSDATGRVLLIRTPKAAAPPRIPKHLRSMSLQPMQASGRISHVAHGKKGEIKLVLLEDGTALRLGKQAQWNVGPGLAVGRVVTVRGLGTENDHGRALEVTELALDGGPMRSIYAVAR